MGRNRFGIAVIIGTLVFDMLVYAHQGASHSQADIPLCYPSSDPAGEIRYDSLSNHRSNSVKAWE